MDQGRGALGPPEAWDPPGEGQCGAQLQPCREAPPWPVLGTQRDWSGTPPTQAGVRPGRGRGLAPRVVGSSIGQTGHHSGFPGTPLTPGARPGVLPSLHGADLRAVARPTPSACLGSTGPGVLPNRARGGLRRFPPQAAFQHPFSLDPRPQGRALSCRCVSEGNSAVLQGLVLKDLRVKWHSTCHVTSSEENRTSCKYVKMLMVVASG